MFDDDFDDDYDDEDDKSAAEKKLAARVHVENTYIIRPSWSCFQKTKIKQIIAEILRKHLEGKEYNEVDAAEWTKIVVDDIKDTVKDTILDRFKIIVQAFILQNSADPGIGIAFRNLWDEKIDNFAHGTFVEASICATVVCFGVYDY